MMKRILSMLVLVMLLGCSLPAKAQEDVYSMIQNALYRIVLRTEEGDVSIGSGMLFLEQNILLTAESCCREGALYAIGEDGEHAILVGEAAGKSGAALMEMATPSSAAPLMLANYDVESLPYIFGVDPLGNSGAVPLYQVLYAMYRGQTALQLSGEEGLLPGAVMVDEKGQIVGLVVAQQAEGVGMYTALEPDSLYIALTGGGEMEAFLPLDIKWNEGLMTISWQDSLRKSGLYLLVISGAENNYYTSFENEPGERSLQLAVVPGHTYYLQVQWAESADQAQPLNWSAMTAYTVPEIPFTQYGFQQECYLASAPAGQEVSDVLPQMENISAAALSDADTTPYLQVINTYDVSAEIQLPMTVSLVAPDGQFYFEEMFYIFSPEYEQNDSFAVPVDTLFEGCRQFSGKGSLPAGEYVLGYSIGGKIAGEYAFTLQDSE